MSSRLGNMLPYVSSMLPPFLSATFYLVAFIFLLVSGRGFLPHYLFASTVSIFALYLMFKAIREEQKENERKG